MREPGQIQPREDVVRIVMETIQRHAGTTTLPELAGAISLALCENLIITPPAPASAPTDDEWTGMLAPGDEMQLQIGDAWVDVEDIHALLTSMTLVFDTTDRVVVEVDGRAWLRVSAQMEHVDG